MLTISRSHEKHKSGANRQNSSSGAVSKWWRVTNTMLAHTINSSVCRALPPM